MSDNTEIRGPKPGLSLVILLAGSLLVGFSSGRWLAPLAAWIGPALIMRYARDHKVGRGILLLIVANTVAFVIAFGAMWSHWGIPAIPIFGILYGILWSLPYLADRLLSRRLGGFAGTFVYPLAATTLEFVNIHANPLGAWGATGFTQYGDLPLMQLASVTGMIGITFLLGWFASVANWTWENRTRAAQIRSGLVAFGTVLAVVFAFGFLRLNLARTSQTDGTVRVAGITVDSHTNLKERVSDTWNTDTARQEVQSHRDAYFEATVREAQAGAEVIVWPEAAGMGDASDDAAFIARAQEIARQNAIYLALPVYSVPSDPGKLQENRLLLIDPAGEVVMNHVKYGGAITESYRIQGDKKLQAVDTPFGVLSGAICYDLDYPAVIRQTGANDTGLMLVPSADWFEIDPIHSQMAVFRAIENGMSLVRQTDLGLSLAVDPYGRMLAQADYFGATDRTLVAQIPVKHVATLYTVIGRWVEWAFVAGFVLVASLAIFRRRVTG